jgi:uncharacterized protein (DUF885 family)
LLKLLLALALVLSAPLALGGCSSLQQAFDALAESLSIALGGTGEVQYGDPTERSVAEIGEELFAISIKDDFSIYNQIIANPDSVAVPKPAPRFTDTSFEAAVAQYEDCKRLYAELMTLKDVVFDDAAEAKLYDNLVYFLKAITALEPDPYYYYQSPFEPSVGVHANIPLTLMVYTFRSAQDIEDYLMLLADTPNALEQAKVIERERMARGLVSNAHGVQTAKEEAGAYVGDLASNPLVVFFEGCLKSGREPFASLSDVAKAELLERNRSIVSEKFMPAYQSAISFLDEVESAGSDETTIAQYANSKHYINARFAEMGFDSTPEDAIRQLDQAIEQNWGAMISNSMLLDPVYWEETAKKAAPADATEIIALLNAKVTDDFPDIGTRPFVVEAAAPENTLKMFSAFYLLAAVDDPANNRVIYYPQNIPGHFELCSTLAHESFPGHLYQHNYRMLKGAPRVEVVYGTLAYAEGYAVYVQEYGLRYLGFDEKTAQLASSYELLMRMLQARIDLGVNYEGWDLEQTRSYMQQWGIGIAAAEVFEGCAASPLLSLPYGLGPLKFQQMRNAAQEKLGPAFNAKSFHTMLLDQGSVPFVLLNQAFEEWLAAQR